MKHWTLTLAFIILNCFRLISQNNCEKFNRVLDTISNSQIRGVLAARTNEDPLESICIFLIQDYNIVASSFPNANGEFQIPNLTPGDYNVKFEFQGEYILIIHAKVIANNVLFLDQDVSSLFIEDVYRKEKTRRTRRRGKRSRA